MKKWQIENSETSGISKISEILFRVFLFPSFRFALQPNWKLGFKSLGKNFSEFSEISEFSEFSTWPFLIRLCIRIFWYLVVEMYFPDLTFFVQKHVLSKWFPSRFQLISKLYLSNKSEANKSYSHNTLLESYH